MSTFEDDLLADAENDRQTVEFIKNYLPQEVKEKFTDEYYCDLLDKAGDNEDIDIDIDAVSEHIAAQARKDKMGTFDPEDLRWVVDGELEFGDSQQE